GGYGQNLGSLQWVSGGGGVTNSNFTGFYNESVRFMGTDENGNIYAASEINSSYPHLDSFSLPMGLGQMDILVFSYNCAGQLRWARHFGSASDDGLAGFNVDNKGNCYLFGRIVVNSNIYGKFGDTIIPANTVVNQKNIFFAALDSSGHTLWVNMPQQDIPPTLTNGVNPHKIQLDKNGIIHALAYFKGSVTWNATLIDTGFNVVKVNSNNGQIIDITKIKDLSYSNFSTAGSGNEYTYFEIDDNKNYYIMNRIGQDTTFIGNDFVKYYLAPYDTVKTILAKWDSSGNLLWHKVHKGGNNTLNNSYISYSTLSEGMKVINNEIYLTALTKDSLGQNSIFGYLIPNPIKHSYQDGRSIILKLNGLNGIVEWINSCEHLDWGLLIGSSINKLPNGDFTIMGYGAESNYASQFINNSLDSIQVIAANYKISQTILLFDPLNGYIKFDTGIVQGVGNYVKAHVSCTDANGNIYLGGKYNTTLYNSTHTDSCTLSGGTYDFYIAKYGNICGCNTYKPWPKLLATTISSVNALCQDVVFGSDSLVWFWGDGTSSTTKCDTATTSHTYAAGGTYNVCLRNYSPCGFADSCFTVNIVLATNELAVAQIDVYPNPTHSQVTISYPYVQKGVVTFYNLQGKAMQTANLQNGVNTIALENLPLGLYTYSVVAQSGQVYKGKLVLQ
ncbi:MAG: T9SS type A sorting domain-containing protein, partial [Chitinophagaceae bacterium]|nr:T9SS type A sorting domain-containing protein [Chitinophagaceae bacterium]